MSGTKSAGWKEGLTDRARIPYRYANKIPAQLEAMIVAMRRKRPTWGARKPRERLLRKLPNDVRMPACSTIHATTSVLMRLSR